jgi:hypothetical protein
MGQTYQNYSKLGKAEKNEMVSTLQALASGIKFSAVPPKNHG